MTTKISKILPIGEAIQEQRLGVLVDGATLNDSIRAAGKGWIGGVFVVRSIHAGGCFKVTKSVYL